MKRFVHWIGLSFVVAIGMLLAGGACAQGKWTKLAAFPEPAEELLGASAGGKMYVIGGRTGAAFISSGSSNVDVVEEYDPAVDSWGSRARMPSARSAMASGVYDGRIYVTGGEGQDAQRMYKFRALEAYDPASNA